jgi:hypothetical protein
LLGVAVALAGPAVFGVLAAPGGIELNARGMALAFGIGALIFWAVVSYFSGAGALGAFIAFGALIYCWLWIPNRTSNFLNDVPGVTNGMIDGSKQYTLNGLVPILAVISLVYAIQLIVRGVQRRRRERADAERLQREQEAAQAQQEADVAAVYPVAGGTYRAPAAYESHSRYDDLFDEPEAAQPQNQADDQTRQFPVAEADEFEHTRQFPEADAESNYPGEDTVIAPPPSADEPAAEQAPPAAEEPVAEQTPPPAAEVSEPTEQPQPVEPEPVTPVAEHQPVKPQPEATAPVEETQPVAPAQEPQLAETKPQAAAPVEETQPTQAATEPVEDNQPAEAKPQATAPVEETQPVEVKPSVDEKKVEREAAPRVSPREQMGSQYRERMDNPEDTGEFHLAFENPVVKPA